MSFNRRWQFNNVDFFLYKIKNIPLNCFYSLTGLICPYAISSTGWIENIIANRDRYETLDNENVPSRSRGRAQYVNIALDGSLNLPPYLRDIVFEFERCYENTHYKRLHR